MEGWQRITSVVEKMQRTGLKSPIMERTLKRTRPLIYSSEEVEIWEIIGLGTGTGKYRQYKQGSSVDQGRLGAVKSRNQSIGTAK
ncbi:hypothetical protein NOK12_39390 [Nocardioides sp. OK12]|nr:hypothetical protein NOK12_39390 [Nocardioides sp. OK12]